MLTTEGASLGHIARDVWSRADTFGDSGISGNEGEYESGVTSLDTDAIEDGGIFAEIVDEEEDIRAMPPPSRKRNWGKKKKRIYRTMDGEEFIVVPRVDYLERKKRSRLRSTRMQYDGSTPSGLKFGETRLDFTTRSPGMTSVIDPTSPITPDGYAEETDRDDPSVLPFGVEFVQKVISRNDVIRSHPDYKFVQVLAAKSNRRAQDAYVKESIDTKAVRSAAALKAVETSGRARAMRLTQLEERLSDTRGNRFGAQGDLRRLYLGGRAADDALVARITSLDNAYDDAIESLYMREMLSFTEETINSDPPVFIADFITVEDVRPEGGLPITSPQYTWDTFYHYLTEISPSRNSKFTRRIRDYYNSTELKGVPRARKYFIAFYAMLDFYISLRKTFLEPPDESFPADTSFDQDALDARLPYVQQRDRKWVASWGRRGVGEEDEFEEIAEDYLKETTNPSQLAKTLHVHLLGGGDSGSGVVSVADLPNTIRALADQYFINDDDGRKTLLLTDVKMFVNDKLVPISTEDVNDRSERLQRELRVVLQSILNNRDAIVSYVQDIPSGQMGVFRLDDERGVFSPPSTTTVDEFYNRVKEWTDDRLKRRRDVEVEVEGYDSLIERIEDEFIHASKTGLPLGSSYVEAPVLNTVEWALDELNTGQIELQPWVISAIDSGHGLMKSHPSFRGKGWHKIERKYFQRDELMYPLFAELCAYYVSVPRTRNPSSYMRGGLSGEQKLAAASIIQQMNKLRFNRGRKKFY